MAVDLRDAADRYELLEKENQAKAADLKKALDAAKRRALKLETRGRNFDKPEKSWLEAPICCG